MSKRLYSTIEWKERSRRRQEDQLRKLQRRKFKKRALRRTRIRRRTTEGRPYQTIVAPSIFSFVRNPEGVIAFLRKMKSLAGRNHLSFDFAGITVMTSDAVAAFIATIREIPDTKVRGNEPKDPAAAEMLVQSGFFDHVRSKEPRTTSGTKGQISQWHGKRVEPKFAQRLIQAGTKGIFGTPRHQFATYRVLIESMTNTRNHASDSPSDKQTWWATVYADPNSNCVCYTILDMGMGIFRSLKIRGVRKSLARLLGITDNAEILKDILEGRIASRTGISYRGKGLPAIYNAAQTRRIRSLVIIANNVCANVDSGVFRILPEAFGGTLLYWEA